MPTILASVAFVLLALCHASPVSAQQPAPAAPPAEEQLRTYAAFRAWLIEQPPDLRQAPMEVMLARYADALRRQGRPEAEVAATLATLAQAGDRAEIEFWNRVLTSPKPMFNTAPNTFLVEMTKGLKPGRALDVGMGQGRNTIYLAQQGWESVGFDPAEQAVAAAEEQARKLGVRITTHIARAEDFDWGDARWDLIVLSYVGGREYVANVVRALRPGGMVILEGFHRDATKGQSIGEAVVFDTNELLRLFDGLRIIRYEDTEAVADFGRSATRVVRLAAVRASAR